MAEGLDAHGLRKDGRLFPIEVSLNPVESEGRKGVLATVVDVSERRKAEALQRLLFRESQHRAKNLFAVFKASPTAQLVGGRREMRSTAD